ncbi:MAG: primosomal protein N' [Patescibacteria group bacterium]
MVKLLPKIAEVLVSRSGQKDIFSYTIPEKLSTVLEVGHVVKVPLKNKIVDGVVWDINSSTPNYTLKPIKNIIDPELKLLPHQKELAIWMSKQYLAPLSDCVFAFLPVFTKSVESTPKEVPVHVGGDKLELTEAQTHALSIINASEKPILLYGVTGSGKTEVYLRCAEKIINQNLDGLILVPEIALTPQTLARFTDRFGISVAVWHSQLSTSERRRIYWQIRHGQVKLVVGSRSALFLPFSNLKLIVIDEEHESSYYQESSPRYHTRAVAGQLAKQLKAKLILGSATPSLDSITQVSMKKYDISKLENRINQPFLPENVIVDLRQHRLNGGLISDPLKEYITQTLEKQKQVVLLLNRRGTSASLFCTTCGHIIFCPNCNVPLTFHVARGRSIMRCHHCDYADDAPALCPNCQSDSLKHRGSGTEKIESELHQLFPQARLLRMDKDTTVKRDSIAEMYQQFAAHNYDILLGTQMIAKGWDIANVNLVGIVLAESGLMLPDFRAAERTASLLIQASGRSGRGADRGMTVIQTYQPDHPIIKFAAMHQYGQFAQIELASRREFHYPPFNSLIRLLYQHTDMQKCVDETAKMHQLLSKSLSGVELVGPSSCFYDKIRGRYRYHILIKILDEGQIDQVKSQIQDLTKPWVIEINPESVL